MFVLDPCNAKAVERLDAGRTVAALKYAEQSNCLCAAGYGGVVVWENNGHNGGGGGGGGGG